MLSPARKDMMTLATKYGKFRYNCLPMGICASGDIFQAKVDKLVGDIKGVKIYIYDIIVLIRDCFKNDIEQLIMIFFRLGAAGLKVNAPKYNFGLKDITYIGYVITQEGTKIDSKKVHGIMDLGKPATNK